MANKDRANLRVTEATQISAQDAASWRAVTPPPQDTSLMESADDLEAQRKDAIQRAEKYEAMMAQAQKDGVADEIDRISGAVEPAQAVYDRWRSKAARYRALADDKQAQLDALGS